MATKTYKISEGGTYTVRAIAGTKYKESNQVKVADMNVSLSISEIKAHVGTYFTSASITPYGAATCFKEFQVTVSIENAIVGQSIGFNTNFSDGVSETEYKITSGATSQRITYTLLFVVSWNSSNEMYVGAIFTSLPGSLINGNTEFTTVNLNYDEDQYLWIEPTWHNGLGQSVNIPEETIVYSITANDYTFEYQTVGETTLAEHSYVSDHIGLLLSSITLGTNKIDMAHGKETQYVNGVLTSSTLDPASYEKWASSDDVWSVLNHLCGIYRVEVNQYEIGADTIPPLRELSAPVLTYSASTGELQWDEVEGATKYEVYKDGVKVADIEVT